jgi:putative ABC transport system substrate-binding protein
MIRREFIALAGVSAVAWPLAARAQQKAMPVIGWLNPGSPGSAAEPFIAGFRQGLAETGWVESQNVAIEYRWAEGHYNRLPALAADLVERKVDVIAAIGGSPAAVAAKDATTTIPIVFNVGVDPVAAGLVTNLAHPGGNLTGFTVLARELVPKQIELLSELVPQARVMAFLQNPTNPTNTWRSEMPKDMQEAANARRITLYRLTASTEGEIDTAFATLVQLQAGGLLVPADPFFYLRREQLAMLAIRGGVPTISDNRNFVEVGGLMSYGRIITGALKPAGNYVGRILAGANPGDLPVQQPTNFELVVNLKTAKELGLTIPPMILARADEVVE